MGNEQECSGRRCTTCWQYKMLGAFYKHEGGKFGRASKCIACTKAKALRYRESEAGKKAILAHDRSNAGRVAKAKANKKYRSSENGKVKQKTQRAKWRKSSSGKNKSRLDQKRHREVLSDYYITHFLINTFGFSKSEITPELIEIKREQLLVHRLITDLKQVIEGESK